MKKFAQSPIVFEKPGFLSEILKTLMSSNYHRIQYFLLKLCTRFLLSTNIYKRAFAIFLFRSWVICKNPKNLISTNSFFTFFDNSKSKQNKNSPGHPFVDIVRKISVKNNKLYGNWSSSKFLIFQFLGNNRALSKIRYRILHYLISIIKL